jgi:hypothetical protein
VTERERLPLVPVTATCIIDVDENVQESVELPEPATLFGAAEQDVLLVFRLTAPEKPFTAVTVIVEVPAEPTFTLTFVGFPAMAKSWTLYVIMTE